MKQRLGGYYQKLIWLCAGVLAVIVLTQSVLYFRLSITQYRDFVWQISDKVLQKLTQDLDSYYSRLDQQLDGIYRYPTLLANMNGSSPDKSEIPARNLLNQTTWFRSLKSVRLYNMQHILKSCYTRTGYQSDTGADIYSTSNAVADTVRRFIEDETARFAVFSCSEQDGTAYIRVVKRVFQNMGYTQVGYIVCDFNLIDLTSFANEAVSNDHQSIWIITESNTPCELISTGNSDAREYMQQAAVSSNLTSYTASENENCYQQIALSDYAMAVCLYTDGDLLWENYWSVALRLLRVTAILLACFAFFASVLAWKVRKRIRRITLALHDIENGNSTERLPVNGSDEIDDLCVGFNSAMDHLDARKKAEEQAKRAFELARYQSLQAQVNPHFLFNTLENIGAVAGCGDADTADHMCAALSRMLRYSIEGGSDSKTVTLKEELSYVDQYMLIINVRMRGEIQLSTDVDESLLTVSLPRLSIQPLVENSIRHGLKQKRGEKQITIRTHIEEDSLLVIVKDNGGTADADTINRIIRREINLNEAHTSIGIANIDERVRLMFGDDYGLHAECAEGCTRMILKLPGKKGECETTDTADR